MHVSPVDAFVWAQVLHVQLVTPELQYWYCVPAEHIPCNPVEHAVPTLWFARLSFTKPSQSLSKASQTSEDDGVDCEHEVHVYVVTAAVQYCDLVPAEHTPGKPVVHAEPTFWSGKLSLTVPSQSLSKASHVSVPGAPGVAEQALYADHTPELHVLV